MRKIDLIVPYVSWSDKNWLEGYHKYIKEDPDFNLYQDNYYFKYFFRGIEKCLPFINNIYLLVSSLSQAPEWLDQSKIKVITHDQFIPAKYLPTFSSCTIELFMYRIPGLSEDFLYCNDDMFSINEMTEEDFYKDDKICLHWDTLLASNKSPYYATCLMQYQEFIDESETYEIKVPLHVICPQKKSWWENLWAENKEKIENSITQTKSLTNYNQHAAIEFMYGKDNTKVIENYFNGALYSNSDSQVGIVIHEILNSNRKQICINDTSRCYLSEERKQDIIKAFDKKFPDNCRYEK